MCVVVNARNGSILVTLDLDSYFSILDGGISTDLLREKCRLAAQQMLRVRVRVS